MEKVVMYIKCIKETLQWLKKWKNLIAAIVLVLFLCTMIIVIILETYKRYDTSTSESNKLITTPSLEYFGNVRDSYLPGTCTSTELAPCGINCQDVTDESLIVLLNNLNLSDCYTGEFSLTLKEIRFTNNIVSNGWLAGFSGYIYNLKITSSLLTDLGEAAFSGNPFSSLDVLVIENAKISFLKQNAFKGARILTLEFLCKLSGIMSVEFNALEDLSDNLNILQFNQCIEDATALVNMTGTKISYFNKLYEIDLGYNSFTTIYNDSFVDTPRLKSLYLRENNLKSIEVKAFNGLSSSIQLITLKNNKLTTLPEGVFDGLNYIHNLDISENPWICDCDLVWFKEFYIKNLDTYFLCGDIPFICTAGNYSEVEFCPHTTTADNTSITSSTAKPSDTATTLSFTITTTTPTTIITTTTLETTILPEDFVFINCINITENQNMPGEGMNRIYSHTVKVRNGSITYKFYQIQGTPNFEINVLNNVGNDYLIWINSINSSDYGCVTNIHDSAILHNLNYGRTYTICLLKESADMVTPFDCTSLRVPLEWKNCAWILNKHIPVVIGGLVSVTTAIIVITSLIMFYTIRQNPKLIKGNKRIVIVRNKSADALVMPNYDKQRYAMPSVYTNSEGYLTPRSKMYERINERRPQPLGTITEKFYEDFTTMPRGSRGGYNGFLYRRSFGSEMYEPPPLPPNHPCDKTVLRSPLAIRLSKRATRSKKYKSSMQSSNTNTF